MPPSSVDVSEDITLILRVNTRKGERKCARKEGRRKGGRPVYNNQPMDRCNYGY